MRDTLVEAADQLGGRGLEIQREPTLGVEGVGEVRSSLFDRNRDVGVYLAGVTASIEGVVIRDTSANVGDSRYGYGLVASDRGARAQVALQSSLVVRSQDLGLFVSGSDLSGAGVVVRATRPREGSLLFGRGIQAQSSEQDSSLSLLGSLIEQCHEAGIGLSGAAATLDGVLIRDTQPRASDSSSGDGLFVQVGPLSGTRGSLTMRGSRVVSSHRAGVRVSSSDAVLDGVAIDGTLATANDGSYGDGLETLSEGELALTAVRHSALTNNQRAGVSVFGAELRVAGSRTQCNLIDIASEILDGQPPQLFDEGGNLCGCAVEQPCRAQSSGLQPPQPLAPGEL